MENRDDSKRPPVRSNTFKKHSQVMRRNVPSQYVDTHEMLKSQIFHQYRDDTEYKIFAANNYPGSPAFIPTPYRRAIPHPTDRGDPRFLQPNMSGVRAPPKRTPDDVDEQLPANDDEIGVEDYYMNFYTANKEPTSDPAAGIYIFDITKLNNNFPIKNIIEAEINPFYVPKIANAAYQPAFDYYHKAYLFMESLPPTQHIKAMTTPNYAHFEFGVSSYDAEHYYFRPLNRKYTFVMPVRDMLHVQFRFSAVNKYFPFQEDVYNATAVYPSAPGPGGDQRIQTDVPHGLTIASVVSVWIEGYNSTNAVLNGTLNNPTGLLADVVDATTLQFTTVPGSTAIGTSPNATGGAPTCKVHIMSREMMFVVRFRGIRTYITNYIAP